MGEMLVLYAEPEQNTTLVRILSPAKVLSLFEPMRIEERNTPSLVAQSAILPSMSHLPYTTEDRSSSCTSSSGDTLAIASEFRRTRTQP